NGDGINPPLCGANHQQIKAKAYPTIREFQVVRALGEQGIISSLCPIQLDHSEPGNPTYGYRPAVAVIIDRLKNALTTQCLPQKLTSGDDGVPCLVLAQLGDPADSCENHHLASPKKEILDIFLQQQREETGVVPDGGLDLAALPVCELPQTKEPRGETCEE